MRAFFVLIGNASGDTQVQFQVGAAAICHGVIIGRIYIVIYIIADEDTAIQREYSVGKYIPEEQLRNKNSHSSHIHLAIV